MGPEHVRDDAGGVWITTGWIVGVIVYAGVLVTWHAGFTAAVPFVVIPPVLVILIAAGNLLGGRSTRRAPRFNRPDPGPPPPLRGGPAEPGSPRRRRGPTPTAPTAPRPGVPAPGDDPVPRSGGGAAHHPAG